MECWNLHGGCSTCGHEARRPHPWQASEAEALEDSLRSRWRSPRVPWLRLGLALGVGLGTLLALAALLVAFATQPLAMDLRILVVAVVTALASLAYSARWVLGGTLGRDPMPAFDLVPSRRRAQRQQLGSP